MKNMKRVNLMNLNSIWLFEAYGNSKNPLLFQDENLREMSDLPSGLPGRESHGIRRHEEFLKGASGK